MQKFILFFFLSLALDAHAPRAEQPKAPASSPAVEVYDLPRCLATALEKNFDLRKAKENIEKQHGVVIQVRAGLLPRVAASASMDRMDKGKLEQFNDVTFGSDTSWNSVIEVTQPVFAGGELVSSYKRQRLLEQAARSDMEVVLSDVVLGVHNRFYDLLLAREQVRVQEQLVGLLEEELKTEQKKRDTGMVSDYNVLRVEVQLVNGQTPLIRARNNAKIAMEELRRVMGLSVFDDEGASHELDVQGELKYDEFKFDLEDALKSAEEKRPEIQRLKTVALAEKEGIQVARSNYFPKIAVFANYGAEKSRFSEGFRDELHGWQAGVRGTWTIFDSLGTAGRVTEARSASNLAQLSLSQARMDIGVEVRRIFSSLTEAKNLVFASAKGEEQAIESLRLAQARFDVGAIAQIDLLEAQVALTQARTNKVQSLHDYQLARVVFERATGEILSSLL